MALMGKKVRRSILGKVMLVGGTAISMVTILPLPWRMRLAWSGHKIELCRKYIQNHFNSKGVSVVEYKKM